MIKIQGLVRWNAQFRRAGLFFRPIRIFSLFSTCGVALLLLSHSFVANADPTTDLVELTAQQSDEVGQAEIAASSDKNDEPEDEIAASPASPDSDLPPSESANAKRERAKEPRNEMEVIVVTARRKSENIQETPLSISAFSEMALQDRGITNVADLSNFTPNMIFEASAAQSSTSSIFIRGVGQSEGTINADPKVGVYIDGVFQARLIGLNIPTWDVGSVEVIRGPQGTLFGKNAIGGAVTIRPNIPGPEPEMRAQVGSGNLDAIEARLMLNLPVDLFGLGDQLFVRGNVIYQQRDGYVRDVNLKEDFASSKIIDGRAMVRYLPTDRLDLRLSYWRNLSPVKSSRAECKIKNSENLTPSDQEFLDSTLDPRAVIALGGDFTSECNRSGPLVSSSDVPNSEKLETSKIHAHLSYETPEWPVVGALTLTSLTAYQSLRQESNLELDATALPLLRIDTNGQSHRQFSQELQLAGDLVDDRWTWTAGAFYLRESKGGRPDSISAVDPSFRLFPNSFFVQFRPITFEAEALSKFEHHTVSGYLFTDLPLDAPAEMVSSLFGNELGEPAVEILASLNLSAGVRFGWEQKNLERTVSIDRICTQFSAVAGTACQEESTAIDDDGLEKYSFGDFKIPRFTDVEVKKTWTAPTGHATLDWKMFEPFLSDYGIALNSYVGFQQGYSSGGFNYLNADADGLPQAFDPETLTGVEVGFRSTFFDNRFVFNATYFWQFYKDRQVRTQVVRSTGEDKTLVGISDAILNAGDSFVTGAELEMVIHPNSEILLVFNGGFLNNSYDDFFVLNQADSEFASRQFKGGAVLNLADYNALLKSLPGSICPDAPPPDFSDAARATTTVSICDDASDNLFPFTPRFNFNVMAQYTQAIDSYEIVYAADYNWQSKIFFDVTNTDELSQNGRGILGFRLTGRALETDSEATLWIKNTLDRRYRTAGFSLGAYVNRYYALPRTYGVTFTQRFGGI